MLKKSLTSLVLFFIFNHQVLLAQCINGLQVDGRPCPNPIQTAVPLLRIVPDARSGGMGDVGIALTPDANSILYNASNLAMADKKWGVSANYTPWLRSIGVKDMFLLHNAGYFQFGKQAKQAIGFGVQYFSIGNLAWTDFNGQILDSTNVYEMAFTGAYSRQLNQNWALGLSAKYIQSNLATGRPLSYTSGEIFSTGRAFAMDISVTYKKPIAVSNLKTNLRIGASISNLGNKITYSRQSNFLPANLGIGGSYEVNFNKNNRLLLAFEFNKLLVPTPNPFDTLPDIDLLSMSVLKGAIRSFSDAPRGLQEEIQEITTSLGLEYWLLQHFALRVGYFHESEFKGGRQYFTLGSGVRYKALGFNVSYLKMQSSIRNPLDNTWRFSLLLNGVSF